MSLKSWSWWNPKTMYEQIAPLATSTPPVPQAIPRKLAAGARVALVSRVYKTAEVGWLEKEAWTGGYHEHTIIRDDGSRYRTEGRIFAIEEES